MRGSRTPLGGAEVGHRLVTEAPATRDNGRDDRAREPLWQNGLTESAGRRGIRRYAEGQTLNPRVRGSSPWRRTV